MATISPMKLKQQSKSYSTLGRDSRILHGDSMFQSQAKSTLLKKEKPLVDDIDAVEWLKDIGFPQYTETFIANLSYDGKILLRSRLATIRIQDLSKMNILNFDHQKQLMTHIHTILRLRQQQQAKDNSDDKHSPSLSPSKSSTLQTAQAKSYPAEDSKHASSSSKSVDTTASVSSAAAKATPASAKASFEPPPPIQILSEPTSANRSRLNSNDPLLNNMSNNNSMGQLQQNSVYSAESKLESLESKDTARDNKESKEGSLPSQTPTVKGALTAAEKAAKRKEVEKRRRSFDSQIWSSISSLRNKQGSNASAAENLRAGNINQSLSVSNESKEGLESGLNPTSVATPLGGEGGKRRHRRRWSFGSPDTMQEEAFTNNYQKAQAYGNMALEYDMMITSLKALQNEILGKFKSLINCEKASIFFINELTRELVLFADDGKWYRIPPGCGIAGYCVDHGETVNIPDAYADSRFNKNIDLKTGFRTRNILAQPVRRSRGGGNIIAVVEMMNKADGLDFSDEDEETLTACCQNVADVLNNRFQELMNAGERFSGSATFIQSYKSSNNQNEETEDNNNSNEGLRVRFKSP